MWKMHIHEMGEAYQLVLQFFGGRLCGKHKHQWSAWKFASQYY